MTTIEFRRIRDFNQTLNAATEYLRQNFSVLAKTTLLLVMPILALGLVSSNISMYFIGQALGETLDLAANTEMTTMLMTWGMMMLFSVLAIGVVINIAVLYEHMRLYSLTPDPDQITVRQLLGQIRRKAGLYIKTTIGLYFTFTFFYIIFAVILLALIGVLALAGSGLFIGLAVLVLCGAIVYLLCAISMLYIIRTVEGLRFFAAIRRSFELVRQYFWATLGLYTVTYLIIYSVTAVPAWLALGFLGGIGLLAPSTDAWLLATSITVGEMLYAMVYLVINSLGMLVVAFRYFSLVETREGIGLLRKIELHYGAA